MFDIGWSEMMLISVVALLVIGPKELPHLMREIGFWMRKAQDITRDMRLFFARMAHDSELQETRQMLDKASSFPIDPIPDPSYDLDQKNAAPSQGQPEKVFVSPAAHAWEACSVRDNQYQQTSDKDDSCSSLFSHTDAGDESGSSEADESQPNNTYARTRSA